MSDYLIYALGAIGLILVIVALIIIKKGKKNGSGVIEQKKAGRWVMPAHRLYKSIPLLNRYYKKVFKSVQQNYPADDFSVIYMAVTTVTKGFAMFFGIVIGVLLISGGNLMYMLSGLLVAYVLMTHNINSKMRNQEELILKQFKDFLEDLRFHYNNCHKVDEAIDASIESAPVELSMHIQRVYEVVSAVDIDMEAEKYTMEPHNKFFMMFTSICATIMKNGDRPLQEGVTVFLNNIKHLQEELNVEILKLDTRKKAFAGIVPVAVLPVLALKPIQMYQIGSMDNTAVYYNGAYGTIVMFLLFFLTFIGYTIIDNLQYGQFNENAALWEKVSNLPLLKQYFNKKSFTMFTHQVNFEQDAKRAGYQTSYRGHNAQKITYAIGCMILTVIVTLITNASSRLAIISDFSDCFNASYSVTEEYTATMTGIAEEQFKYNLREKDLTDEELNKKVLSDIKSEMPDMIDADAEMLAQGVVEKISNYRSVYFKWYYIILMYVMGMVGYFIPDIILKSRKKNAEMEMEDEVIQFQSIALIMMHIKESTVADTLEWMERFSKCFKQSITKCIINLDSGEKEALEQLKEDEPAPQFQKLVNSLMTVDLVGMEAAFDSVEAERNYLREKRRKDNEELIKKKSKTASSIAYAMLFAVIILWLIGPMGLASFSMMSQLTSVMGA